MAAKDLFLITGGGTGAKVAEAFVHLCAAGLGPERVHLLLIDSDTSNGNLRRTIDTIQAYEKLQRWNWEIHSRARSSLLKEETSSMEFFKTEIKYYQLTDQIKTVYQGGVRSISRTQESNYLLDLLYDEKEQIATCEEGFHARPNLGCLLLSQHLQEKLPQRASGFLADMLNAISQAGGNAAKVPVVTAASVFGGTGASMLPIIRGSIEQTIKSRVRKVNLNLFEWGAVKLLPHYMPEKSISSVDPDRYLLDTSSALQFYSKIYESSTSENSYRYIYLLGSDNPARNRVKPSLGRTSQANPPYFEEFLGGMAILDFARTTYGASNQAQKTRARLFVPTNSERMNWTTIPTDDPNTTQFQLGYLLHAAAFYLRDENRNTQLGQGLYTLLKNTRDDLLAQQPFFSKLMAKWAKSIPGPVQAVKNSAERVNMIRERQFLGDNSIEFIEREMAEYFARLFFWADSVFQGDGLEFVEYERDNYSGLYSVMDTLSTKEIDVVNHPQEDNALVRLMRGSMTAMVKEHMRRVMGKTRGDRFRLIGNDGKIRLLVNRGQVENILARQGLNLTNISEEYIRTLSNTNGQFA